MSNEAVNGTFSNLDVDASEVVLEVIVREHRHMWVTFVVGVASFTAFVVAYQAYPGGAFVTVASATADYTTGIDVDGPVRGASGDLTGAAAGTHWLALNLGGVHAVRLSAAGANTTVVGGYGLL